MNVSNKKWAWAMKTITLCAVLAVCIYPVAIFAVEIPLPELLGEFASGDNVIVQVEFGQPISDLSQVSLELAGIANTSWYVVDDYTYVWGIEFSASFSESDPGFWMTGTDIWSSGGVEFHTITPFSSLFGATSDFLSDGQGEMYFEVAPFGFSGTIDEIGPPPRGTIFSASLVFEGTVETHSENWGQIKSLYR